MTLLIRDGTVVSSTGASTMDVLIASTAIANGLALYTVNARDFVGIDGLDVHPLEHPDTDA